MRLSELLRLNPAVGDPILMIEDEDGVPRPVVSLDHGLTIDENGVATRFLLLEPQRDEDDGWDDGDEDDG